jgi:hypothetical protein
MRYFLHLHELGRIIADDEGCDLSDLPAAIRAATLAARGVMSAEVADGRLCLDCCIVIEDSGRSEVGRVPFRDVLAVTGI